MKGSKYQKIIKAIETKGCLLVFPLENRKEPLSIWSLLYPRTPMRWEWDSDGDNRVGELWVLREELSRSRQVVYSKWYRNRATFFSKEIFVNLLAYLGTSKGKVPLLKDSREALDLLLIDSPQSTPVLKENLGLRGKFLESQYNRILKPLWNYLYLVGFGESGGSSFPSLNIGASATLFEELWLASEGISQEEAEARLVEILGPENLFFKYAKKIKI
ncbi:MAG: AlkZ-related protein [Pseudobdellovibrionaceae bacterium]